jgi:hypothetical protein
MLNEPEKTKLVASKTMILRRALERPMGGTNDHPTLRVPLNATGRDTSRDNDGVTKTVAFPAPDAPPLAIPLPNIPQSSAFLQQFTSFQQQQQVQFFAIQAYQRKLALEIHEKVMATTAGKIQNDLTQRKQGRPNKTASGHGVGGGAGLDAAATPATAESGTPGAAT